MTFSRWIIIFYLLSAAVFGLEALIVTNEPNAPLGPRTLLLAAGYSFLCAVLLAKSKGVHRTVMLMASLAILIGYVFRVMVLLFDETAFQFHHLMTLTRDATEHALWFMIVGTIAFWFGAKLALKFLASRVAPLDNARFSSLLPYRTSLIVLGLAVAGIGLAFNVTFGTQWIGSELGFLTRFLPTGILIFILMYIAVENWKELTLMEKVGIVVFFVFYSVSGVAIGSRSAPFFAVLSWLTAVVVVGKNIRISIKSIFAVSLVFVALLPAILEFISIVRDSVRDQSMVFADLNLFELWRESGSDFWIAFRLVADRAGSFDPLVLVVNYRPVGIESHLRLWNLIAAILDGFVPDSIWSSGVAPTGSVFATLYQGFPWGAAHHGAFSGFGFFHAYFGSVLGILGMALLGMLATLALSKLLNGSVLLQVWAASFLYNFVFLGFISGNFDLIASDFLSQGLIVSGYVWFLTIARQAALYAKYRTRAPFAVANLV